MEMKVGKLTRSISPLERFKRAMRIRKAFFVDYLDLHKGVTLANPVHMKLAAEWLAAAQDATLDGGVSALFSTRDGWDVAYPETTGYIIPTFFNYFHVTDQGDWRERAVKMADWLLSLQLDSGGFPRRTDLAVPLVFDTGQIIFGLVSAFRETGGKRYLNSAVRAAQWLASMQEPTGEWIKGSFHGFGTTYDARISWALLSVHQCVDNPLFREVARKHLTWVLRQQLENGWFQRSAFSLDESPSLHTIAYTLRGLLESGALLQQSEYIESAMRAANILLGKQRKDGSLDGVYDADWNPVVKWACLTGNAQTAIIWLKLYSMTGESEYLDAAHRANSFLKITQNLSSREAGIRGGIKGSHPIYGSYASYAYPNWAAKFFLDSLMLEEQVQSKSANMDMKENHGG